MKIVKMKLGFWILPESYNLIDGKYQGFYWLKWNFILKSKNTQRHDDESQNGVD